jgi:hypothetical protein
MPGSLLKRIEVGGDIPCLLVLQPHVRHGVAGHNGLGVAQPSDQAQLGGAHHRARASTGAEPDPQRLLRTRNDKRVVQGAVGRPIEVVTDMSKSRRLGFTGYQATDDAFFDLFAELRADRLIP